MTTRDLVMEMADSLNARGIKLMLYFPPQFAWPSSGNDCRFYDGVAGNADRDRIPLW